MKMRALLLAIVAIGFALRAHLAVTEFGLIHADEQFQTLEPASRLVFGFGSATWEWVEGSRSWLVPLFYTPVLAPLKLFGVNGGSTAIAACRLLMVGLWLLALWRFHLLLRLRGASSPARFLTVAGFSLLPAMIYWAPATFSDSWATLFLWLALTQAAIYFYRARNSHAALAALFFTLAFLSRIQLLPWAGSALLLFYLRAPTARKQILLTAAVAILGAGLLDWLTWGFPFWSFIRNLTVNLLEGAADANGTMPWWAYPRLLAHNLGLPFFTAAAAGYLYFLLKPRHWQRVDELIFLPALAHFLAHSLIPHKETRFLLPMLPLLFYSFALAVDELSRWAKALNPRPGLALLVIALFAFSAEQTYPPKRHYNELDISLPSRLAFADGLFEKYPQGCLLLVHEQWIWSRGELGFGRELRVVATDLKDSPPVQECAYAILPESAITPFVWRANRKGKWRILGKDRWGHYLFRNELAPEPPSASASPSTGASSPSPSQSK